MITHEDSLTGGKSPNCIAIDPGNRNSGWVTFDVNPDAIGGLDLRNFGIHDNEILLHMLQDPNLFHAKDTILAIETPKPRGQPTAAEEMEMMIYLGRVIQHWMALGGRYTYIFRMDVKLNLCGRANIKDKNISQAIRDRFGGEQKGIKCPVCKGKGWVGAGRPVCELCNGEKWEKRPGPLNGVASHVWAALGVGLYWLDHRPERIFIVPPDHQKKKKAKKAKDENKPDNKG